ncbi:MAG TPA: D-lyxose/D-mannose family sugar isomerase [Opitutaceae bacterium]
MGSQIIRVVKRSEINTACRESAAKFAHHGWTLPPSPQWDITDFGLGDFPHFGLVLITLANEPEYCEKLMFARKAQVTPLHAHARKKEDIICRTGRLSFELWKEKPDPTARGTPIEIKRNGSPFSARMGEPFAIEAGERITLFPGVCHAFWPESEFCIIGEVSTANDDAHDNFFVNPAIGRFPAIEEDEPAVFRLVNDL